MRVLIIESDRALSQTFYLMLRGAGFQTYEAADGEEGVDLAKLYDHDIVLLNLNLTDRTGLDVLRQIRAAGVNTPVLMLANSPSLESKVRAFDGGADDFVSMPVHKDELVVRAQAVVRRARGHAAALLKVGDVAVDMAGKTMTVDGAPVRLTGKEYQMVELLALRRGQTITKDMFLNHLYGGMNEPEMKIVDVFICKIRRKLSESKAGVGRQLQTVWGRGYKLVDEIDDEPTVAPLANARQVVIDTLGATDRWLSAIEIAVACEGRVASVRSALPYLIGRGIVMSGGSARATAYTLTAEGRRRVTPKQEVTHEAA